MRFNYIQQIYDMAMPWRKLGYGFCRGLMCICLSIISFALTACHDEPDQPAENKQTILIYMVASNSLSGNVAPDIIEMKDALRTIDTDKHQLAIFISDISGNQCLYELSPKSGNETGFDLKPILQYDSNITSVSPERMSTVISDTKRLFPAASYGLILWSHASAWSPSNRAPARRSFGEDFGHKMNIDKLAEAIPDNLFTFIWMDCCYMSNIECIYQLRNDCRYYIGYPTEVLADGMNYSVTLPYLMAEDGPDIKSAANAMFNDYVAKGSSCTIAVVDMSHISQVAQEARKMYSKFSYPDPYGIQVYSRGSSGPFYDFMQYAAKAADGQDLSALQNAMDRAVIYKQATPTFLGIAINLQKYSGISTHAYRGSDAATEQYYRTLDWYQDVFPN